MKTHLKVSTANPILCWFLTAPCNNFYFAETIFSSYNRIQILILSQNNCNKLEILNLKIIIKMYFTFHLHISTKLNIEIFTPFRIYHTRVFLDITQILNIHKSSENIWNRHVFKIFTHAKIQNVKLGICVYLK